MRVKIHLSEYDIFTIVDMPARINEGDLIHVKDFFKTNEGLEIDDEQFQEILDCGFFKCVSNYWEFEDGEIIQEACFYQE